MPDAVLKAIGGVLSEKQFKRFKQIELQQRGSNAFSDAKVQEALKLTAEQKDKLSKLQKDMESKLMELLTDEQKKRLEELKKAPGVPLKIIINGTDIEIPNK